MRRFLMLLVESPSLGLPYEDFVGCPELPDDEECFMVDGTGFFIDSIGEGEFPLSNSKLMALSQEIDAELVKRGVK